MRVMLANDLTKCRIEFLLCRECARALVAERMEGICRTVFSFLWKLKLRANRPIIATHSRSWRWIACTRAKRPNTQIRFRYVEIPSSRYVRCLNKRGKKTPKMYNQKRSASANAARIPNQFDSACAIRWRTLRGIFSLANFGPNERLRGNALLAKRAIRYETCGWTYATVRDKHPSGYFCCAWFRLLCPGSGKSTRAHINYRFAKLFSHSISVGRKTKRANFEEIWKMVSWP